MRFGAGTLKKFNERLDGARVLGERDICFVDIGPVWDGHEGDAEDTLVFGDDPKMIACAEAARALARCESTLARGWPWRKGLRAMPLTCSRPESRRA